MHLPSSNAFHLEADAATSHSLQTQHRFGGSREYPTVLAASRDREALLKAHAKEISCEQARNIIYAYLDEDEVSVRFTATTMRGMAWSSGHIRLPDRPTLGITLHEIAHIIVFNDFGDFDEHHGRRFTKVLDDLVRSERLWDEDQASTLDRQH